MDMQEDEIKEKNRKIEHAEQCLTTLNMELKVCFLEHLIVTPPGAKNARVHALWVKLNINQNLMVVTICTHAWTAI